MDKCGEATTAAIINFIQRDYDKCQYNRIIKDVLK